MKRLFLRILPAVVVPMLLFSCSPVKEEAREPVTVPVVEKDTAVDITEKEHTDLQEFSLDPFLKNGERKHNIAVVIYGVWEDFPDYSEVFMGMINGLAEIGWIDHIPDSAFYYSPDKRQIKEVIDIIGMIEDEEYSAYLNFSRDLYFDMEWDKETAKSRKFRDLVSEDSGVDLIIALGTGPGEVFSALEDLSIPVVADSISDPLGSGIIPSYSDSGRDNLTVRVDPDRYKRQIRMFYDVVGFKRLGIIYEDTPEGRAYGAVKDIELISREKGFEIVRNTNVLPVDAGEVACEAQYLVAVEEVCKESDAVYFGIVNGLSSRNLPNIMKIANRYKLPTFSMKGSAYVKQGVLFGVSESEEVATGIHNAKNIVQILRGKKPRSIDQIFEHVPHIAINLDEAKKIGYDVPIDIIASSDEIYTSTSSGTGNE
jgi:ABC-type uncharacterized transport system substrate-binding protein